VFVTSTIEFLLRGAGGWLKSRSGRFTLKKELRVIFGQKAERASAGLDAVKITLTLPAVERRSLDFPGGGLSGMPAELSLCLAYGLGSMSNAVYTYTDLRLDCLVFPLKRELRVPVNSEVHLVSDPTISAVRPAHTVDGGK
jgi:hypothetical protein